MKMAPLQPHPSWYRRFWYHERSPLDTLFDRVLIFAIVALTLLAGGMMLDRPDSISRNPTTATVSQAAP